MKRIRLDRVVNSIEELEQYLDEVGKVDVLVIDPEFFPNISEFGEEMKKLVGLRKIIIVF